MTKNNSFILRAAIGAVTLVSFACSGGDDSAGDAGTSDASTSEYMCDPVGANAEMGALLNAPLEADVEVVVKEPQHPGDPGPTDLP